jgi:hypothetical protein
MAPNRAHTFAFFAKLDPANPRILLEHIPVSWLPVVTTPRQNPNGMPVLDEEGTIQIACSAAIINADDFVDDFFPS